MTIENKIHSILVSFSISIATWLIIDFVLFKITIVQFIILQVIIGIGELFSIFVRKKFGLINPKIAKYLEQENTDTEDES
jgi:hypothetical protein